MEVAPVRPDDLRSMEVALSRVSILVKTLKASIAVIENGMHSLLEVGADNLDSRQHGVLQTIDTQTNEITYIIKELEQHWGSDWGSVRPVVETATLGETISLAVEMVNSIARERQVKTHIEETKAGYELIGDQASVLHVLFHATKHVIELSSPGDNISIGISKTTRESAIVDIVNPNRCPAKGESNSHIVPEVTEENLPDSRDDMYMATMFLKGLGGEIEVENRHGTGTRLSLSLPKNIHSKQKRINSMQSEREKSGKSALLQLRNIHHVLESENERIQTEVGESLEELEYKIRELEILCNLALLFADDLSGELEKQHDEVLETYLEHVNILEAVLHLIREIFILEEAGDVLDLESARRVSRYALTIAAELQIPRSELQVLYCAALLKDLGPLLSGQESLDSNNELSPVVLSSLKGRLVKIRGVAQQLKFLDPALALISSKHESYDGSGYPLGLSGEEIPLGTRILSVAEAIDDLIWSIWPLGVLEMDLAAKELAAYSGKKFDPRVVSAFLRCWRSGKMVLP
jgi:response regulator RpfG family c-di-GMP phosphodiesterase